MGPKSRMALIQTSAKVSGLKGPTAAGEYQVCCPWCLERVGRPDVQFKLNLNPHAFNKTTKSWGQWFYCYRCEIKGSGDMSWLQIVEPTPEDPDAVKEWQHPPEDFHRLSRKSITQKPYVEYLEKRGVLEQALKVGAGCCLSGRYAGRVVIPMMDRVNNWAGFSARLVKLPASQAWKKDVPKYLYPRGMDRRHSLWGATWAPRLRDRTTPLYLVEGVFDALPLYPFGLASFGKNVTEDQLDVLAQLAIHRQGEHQVVVCLDGDAWADAQVLSQRLSLREVRSTWAKLPPTKDPGTLGWLVKDYVQGTNT